MTVTVPSGAGLAVTVTVGNVVITPPLLPADVTPGVDTYQVCFRVPKGRGISSAELLFESGEEVRTQRILLR